MPGVAAAPVQPDRRRHWFGSLAFAPLGLLVAGSVATAVGTARALAGCAAPIVPAGAAALLSPQVRGLRADDVRTAERAGASR
ncbi:hypothetical protein [Streptomyces thinghirensis]|uniref:Uncharacterized protein n=1 Tax=Streptomyces thinghirensis TaxID=551547 RepID=A0ABP9T1U2_9ACTN